MLTAIVIPPLEAMIEWLLLGFASDKAQLLGARPRVDVREKTGKGKHAPGPRFCLVPRVDSNVRHPLWECAEERMVVWQYAETPVQSAVPRSDKVRILDTIWARRRPFGMPWAHGTSRWKPFHGGYLNDDDDGDDDVCDIRAAPSWPLLNHEARPRHLQLTHVPRRQDARIRQRHRSPSAGCSM